jgi:branched-subunit amino acid ABC-type transport system permease component
MIYISFLLLGLGAGAVYAALGTSLVLTYRSSGVINFAAGAIATYAAYVFATLRATGQYFVPIPGVPDIPIGGPLGLWPAMIIALATSAALGLLMYWAIFKWMVNALPLAKLVASLGIMIVLEAVISLRYGTETVLVPSIFPSGVFGSGDLRLPRDRLFLTITVIVVAILMWALQRFTRFGLTTRAAADSEKGALIIGISPHRVASLNWMIAALVTGLGGILISPIVPLTPGNYTLLIVPALAAAMVGRLTGLAPTVIAGLLIGALQSEVTKFQTFSWFPQSGIGDAIPLVLIIIVLYARGRAIPQRGTLFSPTLPLSPRPKLVLPTALAGLIVLGVVSALLQHQYRFGMMTTMTAAIIAMSWVVVTGYVGQISLAQLSLAGVSAFMLAHFSAQWHVPFPLSVIAAALVAAVVGIIIGLPALRIRGLNLAIVTLGAALALQSAWFLNNQFNGGVNGANVQSPTLFGLDLGIGSGSAYPRLAFALMIAVFVVLVALLVASLRRSRLGAQMLAVRVNDRAAAAGGINVPMVKLAAFGIASFIAGIGGSLMGYQLSNVSEPSFDIFIGLSMFALVYLTGITSITGAMLAAVFFPGGLFYVLLSKWVSPSGYYSLVTGILLIDAAIRNPEGFAGRLQAGGRWVGRRTGLRQSGTLGTGGPVVPQAAPADGGAQNGSLITSPAGAEDQPVPRG